MNARSDLKNDEMQKKLSDRMKNYVTEGNDPTNKEAEHIFRLFMFGYRHLMINKKQVSADYWGKSIISGTTDDLWKEAQQVYKSLKTKQIA